MTNPLALGAYVVYLRAMSFPNLPIGQQVQARFDGTYPMNASILSERASGRERVRLRDSSLVGSIVRMLADGRCVVCLDCGVCIACKRCELEAC